MQEKLTKIKETVLAELKNSRTLEELEKLKTKYLGRHGELRTIMQDLKNLSEKEKPVLGQLVNEFKNELEKIFNETKNVFASQNFSVTGSKFYDLTLPGKKIPLGSLHPVTQVKDDLNRAFLSLGFEIYQGPEISSEKYVFDSLNFPPDHPARESMDTFWLENQKNNDRLCLRPHLTGESVRYMQNHKPPLRFVYPGRVFRSETTDAGHERCFYQYEALIVDKQVPFTAGQVMIKAILKEVFGREVKIRMRPGFFPFVEPGFEIDMQCLVCGGTGCSVCKHNGWLEMMPGGPPHPNVFKAGGIDPKEWQGFYINIGLDRLTMMKYAINDIRLFHSADLRFLKQF